MSGGRSDGPAAVNDTGHVTNNAKRSRRVAPKDGGGHPLGFPDAVWRRGVCCFLSLVSVASNLFWFVGKAWGGRGRFPKPGSPPEQRLRPGEVPSQSLLREGPRLPKPVRPRGRGDGSRSGVASGVACGANGRHVVKGLSGSRAFPAHEQMRV